MDIWHCSPVIETGENNVILFENCLGPQPGGIEYTYSLSDAGPVGIATLVASPPDGDMESAGCRLATNGLRIACVLAGGLGACGAVCETGGAPATFLRTARRIIASTAGRSLATRSALVASMSIPTYSEPTFAL